jgi:MFS family permease
MSDVLGRRVIIIGISIAGAVVSIAAGQIEGTGWILYLAIALIGGLSTPLYALCIAHTNDYLNPSQMVAASSTLVLAVSVGSTLGAPITAFAMEQLGSAAFFHTVGAAMALIFLFGLWRTTQRSAVATEEAGDYVIMAPTPMSAVLNPDFELEEVLTASEADAEEIQESFEDLVTELANPEPEE